MRRPITLILVALCLVATGWGLFVFWRTSLAYNRELRIGLGKGARDQAARAVDYLSSRMGGQRVVLTEKEDAHIRLEWREVSDPLDALPGLVCAVKGQPVKRRELKVEKVVELPAGPLQRAVSQAVGLLSSQEAADAIGAQDDLVSICAVGDLMFARGTASVMGRAGLTYPMERVASFLSAADVTIANLESPMGTSGSPIPGKLIWFRASPHAVEALKFAGVDGVTLANNHILDYDTPCLMETIQILDNAGILHAGAGEDIQQARRPAMFERKGLRIALLGYNEFASEHLFWSTKYPRTLLATDSLAGTAPIDDNMIREDVQEAKEKADLVIVAFHWGQEYTNFPKPYFRRDLREIARATVDAGADVVLGFHPHAIQGFELYKTGVIAYSLGNFVMDQKSPITRESMMLLIYARKGEGILWFKVVPVEIRDCQPTVLAGQEAEKLMEKIQRISTVNFAS
ncbi:MAG: CapA family protein [Bacillota bacterium]